ncbi:CoA pyrophosphatase [Oceaniglobus trochenteri]|uniref:CoA pyrophosphatase n=1 Tax=Oceaniglobus trochenteri TaxID=2763260 RepID=UPI001CFF8732|nr:CoA pyrophosphatase [Oceaniglobus trochenteri]
MTATRDRLLAALERSGAASSDFDLNPGTVLPPGRRLRGAGVMVPVIDTPAGPQVILTKRSSALKHHPGQIAFPGGKIDDTDADATAAALREAQEEIGLDRANVEPLGILPPHETVTGFTVTPVLAMVREEFTARAEPGEVAEVFRVPLSHVTDPAQFTVQSRHWRGVQRHYYTVPFGPYYIWGATARILRSLAARMT